jgi:uncharacterized membrane protein YoaK (UPF0700 family)
MKALLQTADRYLQESNWKDLALIKLCLFSVGTIVGMLLPQKYRKPALIVTLLLFLATYLPLMIRFVRMLTGKKRRLFK